MDCETIKKLIPIFLDDELDQEEKGQVQEHLISCLDCQRELQAYQKSWLMLEDHPDIEPQPGYVSQFWTKLSQRIPWVENILIDFRQRFGRRKLVPVFSALTLIAIVGYFAAINFIRLQGADAYLANISQQEIELFENFELAENLELFEDWELLEDLEILENWESMES